MKWKALIASLLVVGLSVGASWYAGLYIGTGPMLPFACSSGWYTKEEIIKRKLCPKPIIKEAEASIGFSHTRKVFTSLFENGLEGGSQLIVWQNDQKVIDIWGKYPPVAPYYARTSLQRVFSSSKIAESIAATICVERGLFKWDDPISLHWPDFGKHGKDKITVAQLMRHEAGLTRLSQTITRTHLEDYTVGVHRAIARIVEDTIPEWPTNTRRAYHATTRGYVLGELIRRVDPQHRLIHDFIDQEISQPLDIEFYLTTPQEKENRMHPLASPPPVWTNLNILAPYYLGNLPYLPPLDDEIRGLLQQSNNPNSFFNRGRDAIKVDRIDFNEPTGYTLYNTSLGSSFCGISGGSALAAMASVWLNHGVFPGNKKRVFSEETWKEASECSELVLDAAFDRQTSISKAGYGCNTFGDGWNGWGGMGGSISVWKESEGLAVGYATNRIGLHLTRDPRNVALLQSLEDSIKIAQVTEKIGTDAATAAAEAKAIKAAKEAAEAAAKAAAKAAAQAAAAAEAGGVVEEGAKPVEAATPATPVETAEPVVKATPDEANKQGEAAAPAETAEAAK